MDTSKTTLAGYATALAALAGIAAGYLNGTVTLATAVAGAIAAIAAAFGLKAASDAPKP